MLASNILRTATKEPIPVLIVHPCSCSQLKFETYFSPELTPKNCCKRKLIQDNSHWIKPFQSFFL